MGSSGAMLGPAANPWEEAWCPCWDRRKYWKACGRADDVYAVHKLCERGIRCADGCASDGNSSGAPLFPMNPSYPVTANATLHVCRT